MSKFNELAAKLREIFQKVKQALSAGSAAQQA
jgi:hypothetical protein